MQMHISIWHRFPSAWRIRFNISYSVGMLVITSFSFYTFKSFLSPSVLEGISTGYTILSWQFFFLSVLYRCCSLSSGCIVAYIKSVVVFSSMCLIFFQFFCFFKSSINGATIHQVFSWKTNKQKITKRWWMH